MFFACGGFSCTTSWVSSAPKGFLLYCTVQSNTRSTSAAPEQPTIRTHMEQHQYNPPPATHTVQPATPPAGAAPVQATMHPPRWCSIGTTCHPPSWCSPGTNHHAPASLVQHRYNPPPTQLVQPRKNPTPAYPSRCISDTGGTK